MNRRNELSPAERADLLQAPTLSLPQTAQVLGCGLSALRGRAPDRPAPASADQDQREGRGADPERQKAVGDGRDRILSDRRRPWRFGPGAGVSRQPDPESAICRLEAAATGLAAAELGRIDRDLASQGALRLIDAALKDLKPGAT